MDIVAGNFLGGNSASDLYMGVLQSRSIADRLVKKFKLKELYRQEYLADTYEKLAELTNISVSSETGILTISVEDEDPQRAADMANTYVDALDHINRTFNTSEGHRKRVFLEKRITEAKEDLLKAEEDLRAFQEKHKVVSIEAQARATIEGAGQLKGQLIAAQTELEVLKQFGTERQNEAVMLKTKISELKNQLAKIELGNPGKDEDYAYIPFKVLPSLGMELGRLIRDATIQAEIFNLVTTQYEMAVIEEAKDLNTIQVLDSGVLPDKKSGPKRLLIILLAILGSFGVAVFLAFFFEFLDRLKTDDPERYRVLVRSLWFRRSK
jgi:capsule polysaccharide export protein KpsE/RkpR